MAKRKRRAAKAKAGAPSAPPANSLRDALDSPSTDDQVAYSSLSLHQLFQQQTLKMLDRTDLDEEQKQQVLVAMSCPCCGAGGMSFTAKIKRRS